jgi:hypothetical protein
MHQIQPIAWARAKSALIALDIKERIMAAAGMNALPAARIDFPDVRAMAWRRDGRAN